MLAGLMQIFPATRCPRSGPREDALVSAVSCSKGASWKGVSFPTQRMARRILDESRNLFRVRLVNRVAGTLDFDGVAMGSGGIHALQIGINSTVFFADNVPAGL